MNTAQQNESAYIRTDLASECAQSALRNRRKTSLPADGKEETGYLFREDCEDEITISSLDILDERGMATLGKPVGRYITLSFGKLWLASPEKRSNVVRLLSRELRQMIAHTAPHCQSILAAGLGNRDVIADAIGPLSVRELNVTRHIKQEDSDLFYRLSAAEVSAIAPGVLGQTGIETLELIRGAVDNVSPDLVIVIDALAARSVDRLACTLQLTDTGISPGSGIANKRSAIDEAALGVPVIAIGVPTVVDSSTLVYDALHEAGIEEIDSRLRDVLENGKSFFVSLKEADVASHMMADVIAESLNQTFGNEF